MAGITEYNLNRVTSSISILSLSSPTTLVTANQDEGNGSGSIGFDFYFLNQTFTAFTASVNGWVKLSGSSPAADHLNGNFTANSTGILLCPWWDDLITADDGYLKTELQGTSGSYVRIFEWMNFGVWNQTAANNDKIRFQAIIRQSNQSVEFRYHPTVQTGSANRTDYGASVGIKGNTTLNVSGNIRDFFGLNGAPVGSEAPVSGALKVTGSSNDWPGNTNNSKLAEAYYFTFSANSPPSGSNQSVTFLRNVTTLTASLSGSSTDGTTPTYTILSGPTFGTATIPNANSSTFWYRPNTNFSGSDSFTWRISTDGGTSEKTASFGVVALPLEPSGSFSSSSQTCATLLGGYVSFAGTPNDLTFSWTGGGLYATYYSITRKAPGSSSFVFYDQSFTNTYTDFFVTAAFGCYPGTSSFTYEYRIYGGRTDPTFGEITSSNYATATVIINRCAYQPTASDQSINAVKNTAYSGFLSGVNPAGNGTSSFSIVSQPNNGTMTVNSSSGLFTYTPDTGFEGIDRTTWRISVCDNQNFNEGTASFTVARTWIFEPEAEASRRLDFVISPYEEASRKFYRKVDDVPFAFGANRLFSLQSQSNVPYSASTR